MATTEKLPQRLRRQSLLPSRQSALRPASTRLALNLYRNSTVESRVPHPACSSSSSRGAATALGEKRERAGTADHFCSASSALHRRCGSRLGPPSTRRTAGWSAVLVHRKAPLSDAPLARDASLPGARRRDSAAAGLPSAVERVWAPACGVMRHQRASPLHCCEVRPAARLAFAASRRCAGRAVLSAARGRSRCSVPTCWGAPLVARVLVSPAARHRVRVAHWRSSHWRRWGI
jgi:hypothetical protein